MPEGYRPPGSTDDRNPMVGNILKIQYCNPAPIVVYFNLDKPGLTWSFPRLQTVAYAHPAND
jgi:hypothetical protein